MTCRLLIDEVGNDDIVSESERVFKPYRHYNEDSYS